MVAVYDLGGGTFDACVLRKQADGGFELLGQPEGIERLGGIDLDEAVLGHVQRSADDLFAGIDADDPATRAALSRLRDDCTEAKGNSRPTSTPRSPFCCRATTAATCASPARSSRGGPARARRHDRVRRAVAAVGGVTAADLHAVLLVGGSSRSPLVGQLVAAGLGRTSGGRRRSESCRC